MEGDNSINGYEKLLEKISKMAGMSKEEINHKVEAKQAKLSGLISKDGALQVVASELGVSFDNEKFKIDELVPGMRKVNTVGKIIRMFPVRTFTTKKGDEGKVVNLVLADETSNIKVVLWDTNHIQLVETGAIGMDSIVEICNGSMRVNEVHLGSFSELKPSQQIFEIVCTERIVKEKKISELVASDSAKVRAFIVQVFEPKFFNVCPECKKKVNSDVEGFSCAEHGRVMPERRALMTTILDDGTGTIRSVFFSEYLPKIGITEFDNIEMLSQQRQNLLGKEMFFSGNVKMNSYFNNIELSVDGVEEIDMNVLLQKLEK